MTNSLAESGHRYARAHAASFLTRTSVTLNDGQRMLKSLTKIYFCSYIKKLHLG
jgi:hypothetical protein